MIGLKTLGVMGALICAAWVAVGTIAYSGMLAFREVVLLIE